jgi:hypothetical protein
MDGDHVKGVFLWSCTVLGREKSPGTLGLFEGYGVGNPRESVSGTPSSLVNWLTPSLILAESQVGRGL